MPIFTIFSAGFAFTAAHDVMGGNYSNWRTGDQAVHEMPDFVAQLVIPITF